MTPLYVDRYTIPALAGVILLLAWSLAAMRRWLRLAVAAILILLTGAALHGYYTGMDKESWREAAADVRAVAKSGDFVVVSASFTKSAFRHYYEPEAGVTCVAPYSPDEIPAGMDTAERIVFVTSYDSQPSEFRKALGARIAASRTVVHQTTVAAHKRRNPYAYWLPPIRVTVFERS